MKEKTVHGLSPDTYRPARFASQTRAALDALVKRQMPENDGDAEQPNTFPLRSDLAVIKEGAGALKVETVLDEIAKLEQLRAFSEFLW